MGTSAYRAAAVAALLAGVATAVGLVWTVATGERSAWALLLAPPWLVGWWWIAAGFRRRAEARERGALR